MNKKPRSQAFVAVKYKGFPEEGNYPKDGDGKLKAHIVKGMYFNPPDYVKRDIYVEDANAICRRWPDMYEMVYSDDAPDDSVTEEILKQLSAINKRLDALEEKKKPGRSPKEDK